MHRAFHIKKAKNLFHLTFGAFILCLGVVGAISYSLFNSSPQDNASAAGTVYTVTNLNDTGTGSLRDMIAQADANPGQDTIVFATNLSGVLNTVLGFTVNDSTIINGIDLSANPSCPANYVPRITIKGNNSSALSVTNGFSLNDDNNVVAGLNLVNFGPLSNAANYGAISIGANYAYSDNNIIKCNIVGTEIN
jgi:hypothetical protein